MMHLQRRLDRLERRAPAGASPFCDCQLVYDDVIQLLTGEVPLEAPCPRCGKPHASPPTVEQDKVIDRMIDVITGQIHGGVDSQRKP